MKIVILAPLKRAITPDVTASRPRVIVDLAGELAARGHDVSVIGTGDSHLPGVEIIPVVPVALGALPAAENPFYQHTAYLTQQIAILVRMQDQFDVIHNHMYPEFLALLARASLRIGMVTTIHAQMTEEMAGALASFPGATLVAISESAKKLSRLPIPVIHNGIDTDFFVPNGKQKKEYLLFIGRMSKAKAADGTYQDPKGVTDAIAIAEKSGMKLKIVGNIEEQAFFDKLVKPHLSDTIELVGGVSSEQNMSREDIVKLYQGAIAFINPIRWEEPFGLVMAEALSCGVPVLAYNRGSVPEIVVDSKVGFVIDPKEGTDGFVTRLKSVGSIDRSACRQHAVAKFSKIRMADDYERLYKEIAS
jgi:glycosyltransferase involved in cell wall biosynthesis